MQRPESSRKRHTSVSASSLRSVGFETSRASSFACELVEDVTSVLTLVRRGVAQVCHVLRVEELREQLEVEEEEEGKEDGQEEEEEVESREGRVKERQPPHT